MSGWAGCCGTTIARPREEDIMIGWLKQRLFAWVDRYQQREIERLHAELVRLKAEVLQSNGGQPIRLPPEAHQRLNLCGIYSPPLAA